MTPERLGQLEPWSARDLRVAAGWFAAGGIGVAAGWFGASGATDVRDQIAWAATAAIAIGVTAVAEMRWLLVGRRAIGQGRVLVTDIVARSMRANAARAAADDDTMLVAGPAMTHYHRPTCILVRGKATSGLAPAAIARCERDPCDVCLPGEVPA